MLRFFLILLTAAATSQTVRGGDVVVSPNVMVSTSVAEPSLRGTSLTFIAQRMGDAQAPQTLSIPAGESATFPWSAGSWSLTATTKGIWAPITVIEAREGTTTRVTIPILRAVSVKGKIVLPESSKTASSIKLYFQRSLEDRSVHEIDSPLNDEQVVNGRIEEDRVLFELPAGRLDLALRIGGYTSVYRWDKTIALDAVNDLGNLLFRRGTTISGRIDVGTVPKSALENVRVTLRPDETAPVNEVHEQQAALRRLMATPTARGFFHFDVQPGTYVLQATAGKYRSEELTVTATETSEAVMKEQLLLEEPRSLSVRIDPPLDPTGRAWHVTLLAPPAPITRVASANGAASFDDLFAIPYRLDVGRGEGDTWFTETVNPGQVSSKEVSIPLVRVKGTVQMGTEPLRASLSFMDDSRLIRVWSRADGSFAVDLPMKDDTAVWERVEVESDDPYIRSAVEHLKIEDGELTITIGNRTITGEVVDESGHPSRAIVEVSSPAGAFQITSEDGVFSTRGLPPGRTSLTAFSSERQTGRATTVEVPDADDFSTHVVLTLEDSDYLHGIVTTAQGPLTGAAVWCVPSMLASPLVGRIPTDVHGAFRFARPSSAERMTCSIAARGFASRLLRTPSSLKDDLQVFVRQNGASLIVDVPPDHDGQRPYLLHDGAIVPLRAFAYLADGRMSGDQISFYVDEGDWSLCMWSEASAWASENGAPPPQNCRTAYAAAGTTAQLKAN